MPDYIRQIRALEPAFQHKFLLEAQLLHYIFRHLRGSRGRKGYDRGVYLFPQFSYGKVVRTEIISPLGNAMRLVNHYVADVHLLDIASEKFGRKSLRRKVQELEIAVCGVVQIKLDFMACHPHIYGQRLHSPVREILHLVLHQCYQRGHHQRDPLLHQRGYLETHRLAAAGRQDRQHVPTAYGSIDNLLLHGTERSVPPIFLQYVQCRIAAADTITLTVHHLFAVSNRNNNNFVSKTYVFRTKPTHWHILCS